MKIKVIKAYSDKYTHEYVEVGSVIDVPDARGEELISAGVAVPPVGKKEEKKAVD